MILACDDPFEHAKCRWRIFSEQVSPDKVYTASVQGWACEQRFDKATKTRVVISRENATYKLGPNETPDFSKGPPSVYEEVFMRDGRFTLKLSWLTPRHLQIECEGMPVSENDWKEREWEQVKISVKCPG